MTATDVTWCCDRVRASSTLKADGVNDYMVANLIDGDVKTCWSEGSSGFGLHETVRFTFSEPVVLTAMKIVPGYLKDLDGWDRWVTNGRLRRITMRLSDGSREVFSFHDRRSWQRCRLSEVRARWVEFSVDAVYEPEPGARHYAQDTAVSEVKFLGWLRSEEGL